MAQLKTHILFPVYHSNDRTVFHIDWMDTLTNWRLVDFRAKTTGADATLQFLPGMNAIIKNMHLYAGNTPLDSLRDAHKWLAFTALRRSNQQNAWKDHALSGTRYGFKLSYLNADNISELIQIHTGHDWVEADRTSTNKSAWLSLRDVFGLFRSVPILPRMNNLKLVIEWMPYNKALFRGTGLGVTGMTVKEPQLIMDEVVNAKLQRGKKLPYVSMELDRVVIPAVGDGTKSDAVYRINGFKNRAVRRMLLINQVNANDTTDTDGSSSQNQEKINIRLNGTTFLGGKGVDSHNKKLAFCQDAWGVLNVAQGCQFDVLEGDVDEDNWLAPIVDTMRGVLSYGGFLINKRVSDLEIHYIRTGDNQVRDDFGVDAFDLDVWCEVEKQLDTQTNEVQYL